MGLLDSLFQGGQGGGSGLFDDPQSAGLLGLAQGLLSASGPSTHPIGMGQAMAQGMQGYQQGRKGALDQQKEQFQMDMLKQQIAQATRKNSLVNDMLAQLSGGGGASQSSPATQALGQGAAVGDIGPTVTNAQRMSQMPAQQSSGFAGVPSQAIALDLAFNDGKKAGEWVYDRNKPNIQIHNGYAVDLNRTAPNQFLPSVNTSANGQTSLTMPDGRGGISVSAPTGALDTFKAYKTAEESAKAPFQVVTMTPQGKNPQMMTLAQQLSLLNGGQSEAGAPPADAGAPQIPQMPLGLQARADHLKTITDPQERQSFIRTVYNNIAFAPAAQRDKLGQMWGDVVNGVSQPQQAPATTATAPASTGLPGIKLQSDAEKLSEQKQVNQLFDPQLEASKKLGMGEVENFTKYKETLNNRVQDGFSLVRRNNEILNQLNDYQTGRLGAGGLLNLASTIKNTFPGNETAKALAERVAGGDVAAGQELQQLFAGAALNNLKQTLDGQGRINAAEFRAFQAHSENLLTDPQGLQKILAFQKQIYDQDFSEQQALAKAQKSGNFTPSTWQADWAAQQQQYLNPQNSTSQQQPQTKPKTLQDFGYSSPQQAIAEARNVLMKNPSAKAEVIRRLEAAGINDHGLK